MNYPWLGCAAAVALSVCLMGAPQAQAVDLKQTSETAKTVISAADRAALLPDSRQLRLSPKNRCVLWQCGCMPR